mmetsp:Transcript_37983/g.73000  ORF Transcript_37983/g.73000 Transcript_37983/m.73000 type:complete len:209 (+) Transcript_37983:1391-2017(+)
MVRILDVISQYLHDHVVRILGFHLFFDQVCFFDVEFISQLLEHINDTTRLKFISICFRCFVRQSIIRHRFNIRLHELEKRCQCLFCWSRNESSAPHLHQSLHQFCLVPVVRLFLEHTNSPCNGVNRLGVVCEGCRVVCLLLSSHICCCLLISFPSTDVLLQFKDSVREFFDLHSFQINEGIQLFNFLIPCCNLITFGAFRVSAPLGKC